MSGLLWNKRKSDFICQVCFETNANQISDVRSALKQTQIRFHMSGLLWNERKSDFICQVCFETNANQISYVRSALKRTQIRFHMSVNKVPHFFSRKKLKFAQPVVKAKSKVILNLFANKRVVWWNNNWDTSWEKLFMPYAHNRGADQPAHPCLSRPLFSLPT